MPLVLKGVEYDSNLCKEAKKEGREPTDLQDLSLTVKREMTEAQEEADKKKSAEKERALKKRQALEDQESSLLVRGGAADRSVVVPVGVAEQHRSAFRHLRGQPGAGGKFRLICILYSLSAH